ncbi:MAG: cell division protein FtsZ [Acidobacteria bacterium]|nr:cell division protein FtsZ [Acidobacteriota bacterium]
MGLLNSDFNGLKYELEDDLGPLARIKVIGVGGGGSNAVARMFQEGIEGVEFCIMNTDAQALAASKVPRKLQIGAKITRGLGAGSNPEAGRQAALESTDQILELLEGADMVFVTAGLGGGTGTGAIPVVAGLAKQLDAVTIAVVTRPFGFEGPRRMRLAQEGLAQLATTVDTMITIPNDRLISLVPRGTSVFEAFKLADDILRQAVQGISDIITTPGMINRDFSDVRATISGMGHAVMGTAVSQGANAAANAARQAISSPMLEGTRIAGSRGILINITGSSRLGLHDVNEACSIIREAADCEDVQINFGVILNESMADAVKITVIAAGFGPDSATARKVSAGAAAPPPSPPAPGARQPEPRVMAAAAQPATPAPPAVEVMEPVEHETFDPDDLDTPAYVRLGRTLQ